MTFIPFLEAYRDRRLADHYSTSTEKLAEDAVVDVASFSLSTVNPLARYYANWALANLKSEGGEDRQGWQALSKTEGTRLMRGIYRFQLCCNLIGRARHETGPRIEQALSGRSDYFKCLYAFLDKLEPWRSRRRYASTISPWRR